jgi:putative FmdB family regulatory protein
MPLYEYKCNECGQVFEVRQNFADNPLTTHEGCGGAVQRLLSAPALQFKGSGFYITDYSKGSGTNGKSKEGGSTAPAKTDSGGSGSSSSTSGSSTTSSSASDKK